MGYVPGGVDGDVVSVNVNVTSDAGPIFSVVWAEQLTPAGRVTVMAPGTVEQVSEMKNSHPAPLLPRGQSEVVSQLRVVVVAPDPPAVTVTSFVAEVVKAVVGRPLTGFTETNRLNSRSRVKHTKPTPVRRRSQTPHPCLQRYSNLICAGIRYWSFFGLRSVSKSATCPCLQL